MAKEDMVEDPGSVGVTGELQNIKVTWTDYEEIADDWLGGVYKLCWQMCPKNVCKDEGLKTEDSSKWVCDVNACCPVFVRLANCVVCVCVCVCVFRVCDSC